MKDKAIQSNAKVAKHLKDRRLYEGLTIRALARTLEMPHSFISKIEKHERRLDMGEFIHYCHAMEMQPEEVLDAIMNIK